MSGLSCCFVIRHSTPRKDYETTEEAVPKTPTSSPTPITYADAGVDISRANRTKQRIKYLAHKTFTTRRAQRDWRLWRAVRRG